MRRLIIAILGIFAVLVVFNPAPNADAGTFDWVVDTDVTPCDTPTKATRTTIQTAVNDASPGDSIFVCDGTYNESITVNTGILTITGPGATTADDGVALVKHGNGDTASTVITINSGSVTVEGLEIDATPVASTIGGTNGIWAHNDATISDNTISGAVSNDIRVGDSNEQIIGVTVQRNQLASSGSLFCFCSFSVIQDNSVLGAFSIFGESAVVTGNTVTGKPTFVSSDSGEVNNNTFDANNVAVVALVVAGNNIDVIDNDIQNSTGFGIRIEQDAQRTSGITTAVLVRNRFTGNQSGVSVSDSSPDGIAVIATLNGEGPEQANTFGPHPGLLLELLGAGNDQDAENNAWGLCTLDEIEAKIQHNPDDSALGLVDYDPFVAPNDCSTPTPTPSATPVVTGTPTPTIPPQSLKFADMDCSGSVTAFDARGPLFFAASLNNFESPVTCPPVGDDVTMSVAGGTPLKWGDIDCSGAVNAIDGLDLLAGLIGLAYDKGPNCPGIMDTVTIAN